MVHRFGECELDEGLFQLRVAGRVAKIEPKVFDVLSFLLRHRDRVVSKDELLDAVWPGESVSESVLPHCIASARRAVGDDRAAQRVIQTVHGRGYRFVASLRPADGARPAAAAAAPAARRLFVGREAPLARLREAWAEARGGRGGIRLLVGEPGIGKTRLAEALADEVRGAGELVLWGRAHEGEGAPAYWPWIQVLRGLADGSDSRDDPLHTLLAAGGDPVDATPSSVGSAVDRETGQARFLLFDGVAARLRRAASARPVLLVVDDLHWADAPSLRLLEFLAPDLHELALLLVGTFRDVELRRGHPLSRLLGSLAREPACDRVTLRGLSEPEVAQLVRAMTGRAPPGSLAATVHEMTEGNPFFVHETVKLLEETGRLDAPPARGEALALPQSVRDAVGRRLDALGPSCNEILRAAAVLGRELELRVLARVVEHGREELLARLAEACAAGVLVEIPGGLGRYAFRHALIQQTLYDELRTPERVALHRAAARALEEACADELDERRSELAHHLYEAAQGGDALRAAEACCRAAERALRLLGYEEAARYYERALEAEALVTPKDDTRRCGLLLELGDARQAAGERDAGRASFLRAAELARRVGRSDLLARAAIGHKGPIEMGMEEGALALLEEAREAVAGDHPHWRVRLLVRLTGTPPHSDSMESRERLSSEALAIARALDDPLALGEALNARAWACLGPDRPDERLAVAQELIELARRSGERRLALFGYEAAYGASLLRGDAGGVRAALASWVEDAALLRQPAYVFLATAAQGSWCLTQGRFEEAEALFQQALDGGRRTVPFAQLMYQGQMAWLRYQRGDQDRAEVGLEIGHGMLALPGFEQLGRCALATAYSVSGDLAGARREFDALAAAGFDTLPRNESWLLVLGIASDMVALFEEREHAGTLHRLLLPYSELIASHDLVRAATGSVASVLGSLCRVLGR
ncbi:MAG TPA: AAA family ATPase, partial [Myxococcota bacterium]|nr:AAA family ATPase [Myxococcota bacterium]